VGAACAALRAAGAGSRHFRARPRSRRGVAGVRRDAGGPNRARRRRLGRPLGARPRPVRAARTPPFGKPPVSTSGSGARESPPWRSTSRRPIASRRRWPAAASRSSLRLVDGDEVRERWPGAAPECRGALLAPEDGALDPQALTRACLADARRLGATLPSRKSRSARHGTGPRDRGGHRRRHDAGRACGARGRRVVSADPRATAPLPVEPLRGQMPPPRGPTAARPRSCITTRATSWPAAATPSSAARWSGRVRCGRHERRARPDLPRRRPAAPRAMTQPVQRMWPDSVPRLPTGNPSSARTPRWRACGTRRGTAGVGSCSPR